MNVDGKPVESVVGMDFYTGLNSLQQADQHILKHVQGAEGLDTSQMTIFPHNNSKIGLDTKEKGV